MERNPHLAQILRADETVEIEARAVDAELALTDRRVAIADDHRLILDTPFENLRRIQFDIERDRPATLVIVPESSEHVPQVLAIPPEEFDSVARALARVGQRLVGT